MKWSKSRIKLISLSAIIYNPFSSHVNIWKNEALFWCDINYKMFKRWICFRRTEHEEPTDWIFSSSQGYEETIRWFPQACMITPSPLLQDCMIVPVRFDEDYLWFSPETGLCLAGWNTYMVLIFEAFAYERKSAKPLFCGSFINRSLSKRGTHSFSGFYDFVYKFELLEQNRPQNLSWQEHVLLKIELPTKLAEKSMMC